MKNRNRITSDFAYMVIFYKRYTNGVYAKKSQKLRTFYGIKISVIEKNYGHQKMTLKTINFAKKSHKVE